MASSAPSGRSAEAAEPLRLRFDAFDLDEADARLTRDGASIAMPPKAFAVLCALARQPRLLMTKDALLDAVWGHQFVSESVLKTTVSELRAALSDDARQPRYIETVSRRGYRFIGTVSARTASTVEPIPALVPVPSLTGRQSALARLHAAWERAATGQRQVFWIAGEPGVGKSTLIDHFMGALGPIKSARGQCVEQYGAGEPYLPVLEALAQLCRVDPALTPLLRTVAPTWLLQLPWLASESEREALRRELAGTSQDRMLREFGELLDRYTQVRPLLIVTEDLHWSDHATVHLMNHLARRRTPARLMWLASFRLAEVIAEDHPLKALRYELRLHRLCDELMLEPFSEQEVADYLAERMPAFSASEPFVRAVHARTDGLPLFVKHVIDDLLAQGSLRAEDGVLAEARLASMAIPENLAGIIEQRIASLAPDQRAVLEAASVCGVEFGPRTVADALERDSAWVGAQCDELARQQQWLNNATVDRRADGALDARHGFRHALYRHVFYERIGALARAQLHRRIGGALERDRAAGIAVTSAELATHFERGHEPVSALRHYAEAAESALRHFAPSDAMSLAAQALDVLPRAPAGPMRDALEFALCALTGVSAAQSLGVSSVDTKRAFERALALLPGLPQHPMRGLVLHGLGVALLVRGEYAQAIALAERTKSLGDGSGDHVLLLSACNVLGQIHSMQGRPQQAREWLERGVAACEALGDRAMQAAFIIDPGVTMSAALAMPLLHQGFVGEARARLQAAHARAHRLGQPMARMVAHWFSALAEIRLDDVERVAAHADEIRVIVEGAALAQGHAIHRWLRGWALARRGEPRAGYRLIREAYERNTQLETLVGATEVLGYATEALLLDRDWPAAAAQLDEAMQLGARLGERVYLPQLWVLQARIADAQGRPDAAREAMRQALHEARDQQAAWLELNVLTAQCGRKEATAADFESLAAVYARLSEGLDTAPVAQAHALLDSRT